MDKSEMEEVVPKNQNNKNKFQKDILMEKENMAL